MSEQGSKRKHAVALRYDPALEPAPKVMAKGKGYVAEGIIARANEHSIPLQEDASLVELLSQLEIHQAIPNELYEVVAEVFSYIYQVDQHRSTQGE
ncbi:EscU/YscU/HrcU family type III secretion system export apparatus switch protein [Halalkalibacter sp. APA_J-10(15)]|uniref:EscU/YscU/HrcU family type III secretion system export apparatus switch protein n=1 Tax=Halalkalibacter sp. APA_J-10(15) TaxID=2933805 RepID=UPI001FF3C161|nr:EscU/YscU/HrcU family type III secretion system export apparatus switch protein [Halalkalibacter sp. APA_J-10(15)]MCK0470736.1 EscU/YscU/HrcU family type III secretion system export apparatus switch protein [Halalkalibacter sp. APA_J-10(15)]